MRVHQGGDLRSARRIYAEVLDSNPQHPDALHLYGLTCHQLGEREEAIEYIRRAVDLVPDQPVLRNNLGDALIQAGRPEEAIIQLKAALKLKHGYPGAHQNLASAYSLSGDYDAALTHAKKSVELDPGRPEAWYNLGLIQLDHLKLDECVESFRKALELRPGYQLAATSLLHMLNLVPGTDPDTLAREHIEVASNVFGPKLSRPVGVGSGSDGERIRIGYVSGDFCTHAVNYFFEPVLASHDSSRFETFCYSDVVKPDQTTLRLKNHAQHWRDITDWEDARVIGKIKSDKIDILVDLAGHTQHHRLGVFAGKAAACQVTWLGFPATTGLENMDYRVVDQYTAPRDEQTVSSEQLVALPRGFACFRPPEHAPDVQPPPLVKNGFVTLGSLHKLEKLNEDVIRLWAGVLQESPSARLLLARDQLDDWHRQRLLSVFKAHGVTAHRLELVHFQSSQQTFFDLFAEIDVMLDCFPWSGHTLACCALWMGVPVVSLYGDRHAGRMVASVLDLLGLDELVARSTESYARIVNDLCNDQGRLIHYRDGIRNRFENSPLRDEIGFTRSLEDQFCRILNF